MRRTVFLEGEKLATAGLVISYTVLAATLAMMGAAVLEQWYYSPDKVSGDAAEAVATAQPDLVDEVTMDENEDDHDVDGLMDYTAENQGKAYHCATQGGSFSYMMKVLPDRAMTLVCRYWGGERKGHVFDIAVNNQIIATQDLTAMAPGHYFAMEYKIPPGLTRGKTQVKVEFQAHAGMTAGGLYGCQMLKR